MAPSLISSDVAVSQVILDRCPLTSKRITESSSLSRGDYDCIAHDKRKRGDMSIDLVLTIAVQNG